MIFSKWWTPLALVGVLVMTVFLSAPTTLIADDDDDEVELEADFHISSSLGDANEVCNFDFADAEATIEIEEEDGKTEIEIEVEEAGPNLFYTAWLRLGGDGSPIPIRMGSKATPLAPTTELAALEAATSGPGTTDLANGFFTDGDGEGELEVTLDFLLLSGDGYPFPGSSDPVRALEARV